MRNTRKNVVSSKKLLTVIRLTNYRFSEITFKKSTIDASFLSDKQDTDDLQNVFQKNGKYVVFMKNYTNTPLLCALSLNGSFCHEFDPTLPGFNFNTIYTEANPSKEKPLVVVLKNIENILDRIIYGIKRHEKIYTVASDKKSFIQFIENIYIGLYPHTFLFLQSNDIYQKLPISDIFKKDLSNYIDAYI